MGMGGPAQLQSCAVCLSPFRDPIMLTLCGHTFCKACVVQLPAPKTCPTCRAGPFDMNQARPNYALQMLAEDKGEFAHGCEGRRRTFPAKMPEYYPQGLCSQEQIEVYEQAGLPFGMAEMLAREESDVGRRVFLLDNSGSTSCADGHIIVEQACGDGCCESLPSTRWEEIRSMALDQAKWNALVGTPCDFLLLNSPRPGSPIQGRDFAIIDASEGDVDCQLQVLMNLLDRNGPRGGTPLSQRLAALRARLLQDPELQSGSRLTLTIATDGLPTSVSGNSTDHDREVFVEELRRFTSTFNVLVIIRLTTDEEEVVEFYNKLDAEVELPLDIIDDLRGEATEIFQRGNGWLTYSPLLHRLREAGATNTLFDLLDERRLTVGEISELAQMLLRQREDAPFPRSPEMLYATIEGIVARTALVFDGRKSCMGPPVDLKLLRRALMPERKSVSCSLM
eukprot:TRINITY_DN3531_c0_g1_i1.p1 TRINITY_DN3531_c0_g1~~TRINITY_DN3531_c0_g1_i1.p1  ORF type:complete len:451 (-),score=80.86 TRINITY_DN3531_c0_g1_i1:65-1417(-)